MTDDFGIEVFDNATGEVFTKAIDEQKVAEESVQPRARGEDAYYSGPFFHLLVSAGQVVPPWWSKARDVELRRFWKQTDALKGAMYMLQTKIASIPFRVEPRDTTIRAHIAQAAEWQEKLENDIEFLEGWDSFVSKVIEDFLGTDNGMFFEVIAPGDKDAPITGPATSIAQLDSNRCIRTGDPEFPVVYNSTRGGLVKLHWTRVAFQSQMPSANERMHGVGLCAVSRCIDSAQHLLDIAVYGHEKLGSMPMRGLLTVGGGLDPEAVGQAINMAQSIGQNRGSSRYAPTTIVGDPSIEEPSVTLTDFASLPDGFNNEESHVIGMALIALAFGVDARELFPALGASATRAEAVIQHVKQRGKGPADILDMLTRQINNKVLPSVLEIVFDFQDDAQDRQEAEIRDKRSTRRKNDLETGVTTVRVERQQMVADGEITEEQFVELELEDGRDEDGTPLLALFASKAPEHVALLGLPNIADPLLFDENDADVVIAAIGRKRSEILTIASEKNMRRQKDVKTALAALDALESEYRGQMFEQSDDVSADEEDDTQGEQITAVPDEEELLNDDLEPDEQSGDL